jgi:amino acid transporter
MSVHLPSAERRAPSAAVEAVQEKSASLRKEVGLGALVLTQIMYVVGTGWIGTAGKLGHGHTAFWLLAIALFFLPQAAVVIWLNKQMPLEGGLYQWAKLGFNDATGFLTAWNLWVYTILILSAFGLIVSRNVAYLLGPGLAWFTRSNWYDALVTVLLIVGVAFVTTVGLRVGKWVQGIGGAAQLAAFSALILAPFIAFRHGVTIDRHPIQFVLPAISLLSLNIFGKMAMGAFSGLEYVAIMAGETKDPARAIARSVLIATPVIGLLFILGTASVVALVPRSTIDLIAPVPQTLTLGWGSAGAGAAVVMLVTGMLVVRHLANVSFIFAGNARLPMVTGWDGRLPAWFTRLDPRWRTPPNAISFVAGVILVFSLLGLIDAGQQEAFQLLDNAGGTLYGLTYLVMFALPLLAPARLGARPPLWLRLAALSGFAVTALYTVLNVFPIIDVPNPLAFTVKIVAVIVVTNLVGVLLLFASRSSAERRAPSAETRRSRE